MRALENFCSGDPRIDRLVEIAEALCNASLMLFMTRVPEFYV